MPLSPDLLAAFLECLPARAALFGPGGELLAASKAWHDFEAASALLDPVDQVVLDAALDRVLTGQCPHAAHQYRAIGSWGEAWYLAQFVPLRSDAGGALVLHHNITPFREAEYKAQAASKAKSDFVANLSHELRTPLNAIIGFSEMLMLEAWGPMGDRRYLEYAGDIHTSGRHLLSLINEVLDLSKVEAGRLDLREELIDLGTLALQSLQLVAERAGKAGLGLDTSIAPALPRLWGDTRLIHQLLLNLLSNAIKFTPTGGRVTLGTHVDEDGWLRLWVQDTGIGIAPEHLARVLEPFGQVDSEQARLYSRESTGLGLPLCSRFVELHDGRLTVDSQVGVGSTLTAHFPPSRLR